MLIIPSLTTITLPKNVDYFKFKRINYIFIYKKIVGDCGSVDFFYTSAFSNACKKNLAGE
jgi:hypothetical protein